MTLNEVAQRTGFNFDASGATPTPAMTRREHQALLDLDLDPEGEFAAEVRA